MTAENDPTSRARRGVQAGLLALATTSAAWAEPPRIAPLPPAEWSAEQRELLAPYLNDGKVYNVFATLANHPELARDWLGFALHILKRNSLPARERELLILRTGWLCEAEYEWAHHVVIGKESGLTADDVERIMQGPNAPGLDPRDRLLLRAADELYRDQRVSQPTWDALGAHYDTRQLMDIVMTVGQYTMVSMALKSFGVQLEDGFTGFERAP
ncbi:MAG: carboxymuconolactone decarboxylase family protein [Gammaproteobacteria bacterium]|nr:carboxymuconolactone decarboxylase family protein [Gammaproteobacteria bacterium]MCP5201884.1 carboxymuconolactone decarboxylase family protein [Gammaproteobacteria bacterium]